MGRKVNARVKEHDSYDGRYDHLYGSYYGSLYFEYKQYTQFESTTCVSWEPYTDHQIKIYLDDGGIRIYNGRYRSIRTVFENDHSDEAITRDFSFNLQERMYDKELTQKDLSKLTGISQSMISNYITRERTPSLSAALRIADALECSVYDLVES